LNSQFDPFSTISPQDGEPTGDAGAATGNAVEPQKIPKEVGAYIYNIAICSFYLIACMQLLFIHVGNGDWRKGAQW